MSPLLENVDTIRDMNEFVEQAQTGTDGPARYLFNSYFATDSAVGGNLDTLLQVDAWKCSGTGSTDNLADNAHDQETHNVGSRVDTTAPEIIDREAMQKQLDELKKLVSSQSMLLTSLGGDSKNSS
jgi:hypothetical protein